MRILSVLSLISLMLVPGYAAAQLPAPEVHRPTVVDAALVDIESRASQIQFTDLAIGGLQNPLAHMIRSGSSRLDPNSIQDNFVGGLAGSQNCPFLVGTAFQSDCFTANGSSFTSRSGNGSSLIDIGGGILKYTTRSGEIYTIDKNVTAGFNVMTLNGVITKIEHTDGSVLDLYWQTINGNLGQDSRLITVEASNGFSVKYEYASDNFTSSSQSIGYDWKRPVKITAFNRTVEGCSRATLHCSFTRTWPSTNYTWTSLGQYVGASLTVSDFAGRILGFRLDPVFRVVGYKPADATGEQFSYTYCRAVTFGVPSAYLSYYGDPCTIIYSDGSTQIVNDGVKWATKEGRQWNYNPILSIGGCGCYYYNTSTDPEANTISVTTFTHAPDPELLVVTDSLKEARYTFGQSVANPLLSTLIAGEAETNYQYDSRGNLTEVRRIGSGLPDLVISSTYPASCINQKVCNQASSVTDANQNVSQYSYDANSGGVTVATAPAVAGGAPQKRYEYVSRYATFLNDAGVMSQASAPIWLVASVSQCISSGWTGSGCAAGPNDEIKTLYDYGPSTGPNNLMLVGETAVAAGQSLKRCYTYDVYGNRVSSSTPRAGLAACY